MRGFAQAGRRLSIELKDGKIKRFDCYPEGSVIFAQLGVLNNLDAALSRWTAPSSAGSKP
jgi:hypothetical protein